MCIYQYNLFSECLCTAAVVLCIESDSFTNRTLLTLYSGFELFNMVVSNLEVIFNPVVHG